MGLPEPPKITSYTRSYSATIWIFHATRTIDNSCSVPENCGCENGKEDATDRRVVVRSYGGSLIGDTSWFSILTIMKSCLRHIIRAVNSSTAETIRVRICTAKILNYTPTHTTLYIDSDTTIKAVVISQLTSGTTEPSRPKQSVNRDVTPSPSCQNKCNIQRRCG